MRALFMDIYPPVDSEQHGVVVISQEARALLFDWSRKTGRPMNAIADKVIKEYIPQEVEKYQEELSQVNELQERIALLEAELKKLRSGE